MLKGDKVVMSSSLELIGRSAEFQRIVEILAMDGDLLIVGVPGSGRRTLVRGAAQAVKAIVLEVDCIRATDGERFLQLLVEAINQSFDVLEISKALDTLDTAREFFAFHVDESGIKLKLMPQRDQKQLWKAFEILIELPQQLVTNSQQQAILILHSFPHIRSWDRQNLWEATLRREIKQQDRVSYILIATIAETTNQTDYPLEIVQLAPLANEVLALWTRDIFQAQGLIFDFRSQALQLFINAVQGHIGDAMTLVRRLQVLRRVDGIITEEEVEQAISGVLKDLSITFESLLMLLPANQVHILECLAIDPTEKPQSREYIQKHGLSRGGSLQGALTGLQHKGLIYGAEQNYKLALPLLALWLRQRLS